MKIYVGLMQPYLFPYLGYFQLIKAVNVFALGDDLQYEKESWINRNRILVNNREKLITFPLRKDSHRARINERTFSDNFESEIERMLKIIENAYANAQSFDKFFPVLEKILKFPDRRLSAYAENSIRSLCRYMSIDTPIRLASEFSLPPHIDKQDRVIRTVRLLGGDAYVNLRGGTSLYNEAYFIAHGLALRFHRMDDVSYRQFGKAFLPNLSIIDVLMFNSFEQVQHLLDCCTFEALSAIDRQSSDPGAELRLAEG